MNIHLLKIVGCVFGTIILTACGQEDVASLLASAKAYQAKHDNKAAIVQLKNVLQRQPDMAEARFLLGQLLLENGDVPAALSELGRAKDAKFSEETVAPVLARALIRDRQFQQVIDNYSKLSLSDKRNDADLKTSVAMAYAAIGQDTAAKDLLSAALRQDAHYDPARRLQARVLADNRHFDDALAVIDQVLASNAADDEAWQLKGDFLIYGKSDSIGAIAAYRRSLEIRPEATAVRSSLISVLLATQDIEGASTQLELLRKALPRHPQTQFLEAQLAFTKRDYKGAQAILDPLVLLTPDNPKVLQLAGVTQFNLHLLSAAENSLGRALRLSANLPVARRILARVYLQSGQPDKALSTLAPLSTAGSDAEAALLAAEANLQKGELRQAEFNFKKATELNPKDVKSRVGLALASVNRGNADAAVGNLREIAAADDGIYADLALVNIFTQQRDYAKAYDALEILEKKQPKQPLAANIRGRLLLSENKAGEARKSFERALQIDPVYMPSAKALAALDVADGHPDAARKRFEMVLSSDPENLEALLALAGVQARLGAAYDELVAVLSKAVKLNPLEISPRILLIDQLLKGPDTKKALVAAQDAAAVLPDSPEIVDALGRAQLASGDGNQAIMTFRRLATLTPQSPVAQLRLADASIGAKNYDAAVESLRQALTLVPNFLPAQQRLVDVQLKQNHPQEALAVAREVQKQRPRELAGFVLEGEVQVSQANLRAAADIYRKLAVSFPKSTVPVIRLHSVLIASGDVSGADKLASDWMKANAGDVSMPLYLGEIALAQHRYAVAEEKFRNITLTSPDNAAALNNLAWTMVKLGKPGASTYAQKATGLAPSASEMHDTLSLSLAAENRLGDALSAEQRAVALAPANAKYRLALAKLYIQSGEKAKARSELRLIAQSKAKGELETEAELLLQNL